SYLVKKGHTRIGLLNGPSQLQATAQRRDFFEQGLKKNLLKANPSLVVETDLSEESTHAALGQLLALPNPPTAVVAFNDYVALDAIQYLRSQKSKKAKDIRFVSFAHLPLCRYLDNPPLASVEQFPYEQGAKAMEMLYSLLNYREEAPANTQIVLESELRAIT
ncbi:MAG TPA: substrate-binding domain-containing protein, partial [Chitinophagaceae bacterium]|nr:substrate-binding domain-containing protein [Chitinophagaceae bacterium]